MSVIYKNTLGNQSYKFEYVTREREKVSGENYEGRRCIMCFLRDKRERERERERAECKEDKRGREGP